MAKDLSLNINPMDFHPCDTPRGMCYYNMEVLTNEQQEKLNALKIETIRENQKYLAEHPEIRACIALVTKVVLRQRPRTNIHEVIAEYFAKSRLDIELDVQEYLSKRKPHSYESTSAFNMPQYSQRRSLDDADVSIMSSVSWENEESRPDGVKHISSMIFESIEFNELEKVEPIIPPPTSLNNIGVDYEKIRKVERIKNLWAHNGVEQSQYV